MSHRPIEQKKINKLRRQLQQNAGSPPAFIDLVDWLQMHRHADTAGQARAIILAGRVKSESHTLGISRVPKLVANKVEMVDVVDPLVPASLRPTFRVANA